MSLLDKNKFSTPDAKDLAKNVADTSGLTDKVNQKISDLTAPVSEAVDKAKETYAQAQQTMDSAKEKLGRAQKIVADVSDSDLAQPFTNFTITPPEVIEKEMLAKANKYFASYGGDLETQLKNSHIVYSTITIDGEDVLKDSHFTLEIHQKMADHDEFTISCYAEAFGDRNTYPMTNSRNLLGKRTTIQLKQFGQTTFIFTGIITEITNKKIDGHNKLFLTGKAPTILLENGQDCQSFEELPLDQIITQATSEYQTDLISWDLRPNMKDTLQYTVQFKESDWAFVKRLATRYGEWLYYNGQQIVFGGFGGKTVELVEEQDVFSYELKMKLVPQKFTYVGYDAKQAKNHTVDSESIPITHRLVNPFQQHAIKASEEIYSKVPLSLYNQSLLEKGEIQLKQAVERQKLNRQNVFFLEAKTGNPNIRLGDIVKLKAWMPGHEIFKSGEVPLESYKVIDISHFQDVTEGYYNLIVGVPMDNQVPAYMDEDAIPECEEQSAIVMDNNDPEGMSRIRVQFPWQQPFNGMTPWIRSITPYAGKGKGMHVVPEIGEEVIVSFENGNAEKPVSLGAMFNGGGKSGHGGSGNYMKGLQTAAGSNLTFNDQKGDMTLADQGPSQMKFDGSGNSSLKTSNTHMVNVGDNQAVLQMGKDGKVSLTAETEFKIRVGASTVVIDKTGKITVNGKEIKVDATQTVDVTGKTAVNTSGPKVTITGQSEVIIDSKDVKIQKLPVIP